LRKEPQQKLQAGWKHKEALLDIDREIRDSQHKLWEAQP